MPLRKIMIIDGHPDPNEERFCHALGTATHWRLPVRDIPSDVVACGERSVRAIRSGMEQESVPADLEAQEGIRWADHLVLVYPLWLGTMPALLQAFLEQVLRGFRVAPRDQFRQGTAAEQIGAHRRDNGHAGDAIRVFILAQNLMVPSRNVLCCGYTSGRHADRRCRRHRRCAAAAMAGAH
jgi:multimeric flavodoxin WrbA